MLSPVCKFECNARVILLTVRRVHFSRATLFFFTFAIFEKLDTSFGENKPAYTILQVANPCPLCARSLRLRDPSPKHVRLFQFARCLRGVISVRETLTQCDLRRFFSHSTRNTAAVSREIRPVFEGDRRACFAREHIIIMSTKFATTKNAVTWLTKSESFLKRVDSWGHPKYTLNAYYGATFRNLLFSKWFH